MCHDYKNLAQKSESERIRYQSELMSVKILIDRHQNSIIKLTEEARLKELDHEIIGNQLK